jgi:PAS domain S-box-containing protein
MTDEILGRGNRIGRRMILLIILFSSMVTLLITLVQLVFDYRQQRGELDSVLDTVAVHVPTISSSVWALDKIQAELALQALVQMPNIERASVIISKPQRQWSAGVNNLSMRVLTRNYPLIHQLRGEDRVIGSLEVVASLDAIYLSVAKHALVIFLSNGLKTFFVAIFMFFAFRRVVTERLEGLADKVVRMLPENLTGSDREQLFAKGKDELDTLNHAFDQMHSRLKAAMDDLNHSNVSLRFENTERRRAEESLKRHQQHLEEQVRERASLIVAQKERLQEALNEIELILENASIGITKIQVLQDGSRLIHRPNRALAAVLGYSVEELEGKNEQVIYPDNYGEIVGLCYERYFSEGRTYRGEHQLLRRNGQVIDVWLVGTAIDSDDLSRGAIWLIDDITARKQAERVLAEAKEAAEFALQERECVLDELNKTHTVLRETQGELIERENLAALGALVAGIAHELETPIGNTLMSAGTLVEQYSEMVHHFKEGLKRSQLEKFLETVGQNSQIVVRNMQRAAELVEGFRRVAVDQSSSLRRQFLLDEVVSEIIFVLHPSIRKTPFVINSMIPKGIEMDSFPGPLGQVLTNLLNNALIHAFEGCNHGTVCIEARLTDPGYVELEVRDDGVGVPRANLSRIFEPFFSTRFGQGGSGLGLSIVSNLVVSVLGGKILVASQEGQGTTFSLILPLVAPDTSLESPTDFTPASVVKFVRKQKG